jgi:hypothetical protein
MLNFSAQCIVMGRNVFIFRDSPATLVLIAGKDGAWKAAS